jgi:hypothetical protein
MCVTSLLPCHRRLTAGAGDSVAVDQEQVIGYHDFGKILAQAGDVFPVDGAAVAVQQSRPCQ